MELWSTKCNRFQALRPRPQLRLLHVACRICTAMLQVEAEHHKHHLTKDVILSKIPAFPPVVLRALDLLSNDSTKIPELARLISSDATLSAQVLRMANSALFGYISQIESVQHGVVALGLSRLQSLIMTVATTNYMRGAFHTEALTRCWRHMLACAVLCRELARASGEEADRAYTLGLLHDIGRLGLLVGYPKAYQEILDEAHRDAVSLLDLEKRRFGIDHCEAGRLLMAHWGLPQGILVATGRHHDPPQGGPFDLLHIVYSACRLADLLGYFVVPPLQSSTFDELALVWPATVRERVPQDQKALQKIVESSIWETEIAQQPSRIDVFTDRDPAVSVIGGEPHAITMPAAPETAWWNAQRRPIVWDFLVVAVTVVVFVLVMLGLKYLGRPA
jgi:HD-like signal output (HDOD) protein